jgi:hypothetical protein
MDEDLRHEYDRIADPLIRHEITRVAALLDEAQRLTAQGDPRGLAATQHAMRRLLLAVAATAARSAPK